MTLPVFVIGLRSHPYRRQTTLMRLKNIGVDAQPYDGVNPAAGDILASEEKTFKYKRLFLTGGRLVAGEVGCYFAHYRLMKHILSLGLERAVVMECDACLDQPPQPALGSLLRQIERLDAEKYELIYLYYLGNPKRGLWAHKPAHYLAPRHTLHFAYGPIFSTAAYVITRSGIEKLLPRLIPMTQPIDSILGRPYLHGLRTYIVDPRVVTAFPSVPSSSIRKVEGFDPPMSANGVLARLDRCFCSTIRPLAKRWRPLRKYLEFWGRWRRWNYMRRHRA